MAEIGELKRKIVKIVVIGGTRVLGSKVVQKLSDRGHDAVAASPRTGVNALTGDGLPCVLTKANVVVGVANSLSFDDGPVMKFFTKSITNYPIVRANQFAEFTGIAPSMTVGEQVRVRMR